MVIVRDARRLGALGALLAALVAVAVWPAPARAATATEKELRREMLQLTNRAREQHGRDTLDLGFRLSRIAEGHSLEMAGDERLYHSDDLSGSLPGDWIAWGENVGYTGGTIRDLHRAFMKSPAHRHNVLYSDFERIGIGVEIREGVIWVTLIFLA